MADKSAIAKIMAKLETMLPRTGEVAVDDAARAALRKDPKAYGEYLKTLDKLGTPTERSKALGFGERTWYHGATTDIPAFQKEALGQSTGAQSAKQGFFFASDPSTASDYAQLAHEKGVVREGDKITTKMKSDTFQEPEKLHYGHYEDAKSKLYELESTKAREEKRLKTLADWSALEKNPPDWIKQSAQREGKTLPEFIAEKTQRIKEPIKQSTQEEIKAAKEAYHQSLVEYAKSNDPSTVSKMFDIDLENKYLPPETREAIKRAQQIGEDFQTSGGQQVGAYRLKGNPDDIHVKNYKGQGYRDSTYADEMGQAKADGKNAVLFKNTYDPADPNNRVKQDIAAVFGPSQIRSTNAAFDPRFKDSADVLALTGGNIKMPNPLLPTAQKIVGGIISKANQQQPISMADNLNAAAQPIKDAYNAVTAPRQALIDKAADLLDFQQNSTGVKNPEFQSFASNAIGMVLPDETSLLPGAKAASNIVKEAKATKALTAAETIVKDRLTKARPAEGFTHVVEDFVKPVSTKPVQVIDTGVKLPANGLGSIKLKMN